MGKYLADSYDAALRENADLKTRLAEAERDAARYRFIKQWARRLDIMGYSLTSNEHFEPRIDEAMKLRPADSADVATDNCGLCGQPRADHAEVSPGGKPMCRMKADSAPEHK